MPKLNEIYTITATLFENTATIIYQALRKEDDRRVILKAHKKPDDAYILRREYDLLHAKHIDGIANVLDLFTGDDGGMVLVSEDHGGTVLEDYLRFRALSEKPMDAADFLVIAENAATALAHLHDEKIVHRDIKPQNLMIDPQTLALWFIDFGLAVQLKRGIALRQKTVEGTLEYLSPEQTGRVNKPIDYRSDLYALGITLYRVLTGQLPFAGKTTMELIHQHITVTPVPPAELADIPGIASDEIMKLLQKRPEDRYQTAAAAAYDFARCRALMQQGKDSGAFRLAEMDIFHNLGAGRKLYGRTDTLRALKEAFDRINKTRPGLVRLDGSNGVDLILGELEAYAGQHKALVFRSDPDRMDRDAPYYVLRSAFGQFEALVYASKIPLSAYRESFLHALGDNAQVLIDMLPQMQNVLGKQPAVPQLGAAEAQQRAEQVFSVFLQALCDVPYPCLLVLDDVRNVDDASLRLLLAALENPDLGNCMVVLASQEDDLETGERLSQAIAAGNLRHVSQVNVHMQPLTVEDVAVIIQDIFPQEEDSALELAQYVHAYAQGSMRRIESFLKELYHSGVIAYDDAAGQWAWSHDAIDPAYFQDIQSRVERLIAQLSPQAADCLRTFACLGQESTRAQAETVFAPDMAFGALLQTLQPALQEGLLAYDANAQAFAFESNRLQQIVYATGEEGWRRSRHLDIARRLYAQDADNDAALAAHCAVITLQYASAGTALWTDADRQHILRMNRLAGDEAMRTLNAEKAVRYYAQAAALLSDDPQANEAAYGDVLPLLLRYASGIFSQGDADTALQIYHLAIRHAKAEGDRFTVYQQLIRQYIAMDDWRGAQAFALEYMQGSALLPDAAADLSALTAAEEALFTQSLDAEGIEYFLRADMAEDAAVLRDGSMLAVLAEAAEVAGSPEAAFLLYRTLNHAYANGPFPDVERAIALLAARFADRGDYGRAEDVCNFGIIFAEMNDLSQTPLWAVYCLYILHWVEPLARIPEVYQKMRHIAMMEGNVSYAAAADLMLLSHSLYAGVPLAQVSRDVEIALHSSEKVKCSRYRPVFASAHRQYIRCLTGHTKGMDSFDDRTFSEEALQAETGAVQWRFIAQVYCVYRMQALYTFGLYEQAAAYAGKLLALTGASESPGAFLTLVQFHYYYALSLLRLCEGDAAMLVTHRAALAESLQKMKAFAEAMPENFDHKLQLLVLEHDRITGGSVMDISAYSTLGNAFHAQGLTWDEAIIQELLLHHWNAGGIVPYQTLHGQNAGQLYGALGAKLKAMEFSLYHGEPEAVYEAYSLTHTNAADATQGAEAGFDATDYRAILRVISRLASETNIGNLLRQLLSLLMENADADKAQLFLLQEDELLLYAFQYADTSTQTLMSQELPAPLKNLAEDILPHKLVALASDKRMALVANAADNEYIFLGDAYLEKNRPESFACLPILAGQALLGVVYLENARMADLFPPSRVGFLGTVLVQASLLIQNALEVRSLEGYTADLEKQLTSYITQSNTLIAGIAHEVNTPLGVCVTVATRLQARAGVVLEAFGARTLSKTAFEDFLTESRDGLDILCKNITRASDLVQNFKRISVNQSNEVFEDVELMGSLRSIAEYIRPATKQVIEACTVTGPESVMLHTSGGALAQVFTNLLMNSANHAFPGRERRENLVAIEVTEAEDEVQIIYSDNGRGMTEEEREKIFVPFFTTRRGEGGSGLGGHIIMTNVTQTLGGSIHCISEPGRGTSFIIKLPRHKA